MSTGMPLGAAKSPRQAPEDRVREEARSTPVSASVGFWLVGDAAQVHLASVIRTDTMCLEHHAWLSCGLLSESAGNL